MRINLNDTIEFTLTQHGADLWTTHYGTHKRPKVPGPTSAQIWVFMQVFGPSMKIGLGDLVIEANTFDTLGVSVAMDPTSERESFRRYAEEMQARQNFEISRLKDVEHALMRERDAALATTVEAKLAAYTDAFARAQRTLLDAGNLLRELCGSRSARVDAMIDACNLAAMNPGVVEHAEPEDVGEFAACWYDGCSWNYDRFHTLVEAERMVLDHPERPGNHGTISEVAIRLRDLLTRCQYDVAIHRDERERALARADQLHVQLSELSDAAPVTYQTGQLAVKMPAVTERHDQLIGLARAIGVTSGSWTLRRLAEQARVRRETRDEALAKTERLTSDMEFRRLQLARALGAPTISGEDAPTWLDLLALVQLECNKSSELDGMPWSVGAGRLSVELHALTDLLALARSLGAEAGSFTVHELARIAGNLHAASYTEHSIALNKIHALLHNKPESTGPMPAGSEASIAATVERVQILVGALRKATDAIVGGAA